MMIGRTLIDELFERWLMLQQPADADDARKNKRADSARMQKDRERERPQHYSWGTRMLLAVCPALP